MHKWPILPMLLLATAALSDAVQFDTYFVRWWGTEGSKMGRPIYRMVVTDNGVYGLHYGIMPGRPLDDYTLPYWPVRSFLSIVNGPIELAHQCQIRHSGKSMGFIPRSGVELADVEAGLLLKITNRSTASSEDATLSEEEPFTETNPCMVEQFFLVNPNDPVIQALTVATNVSDRELTDVDITVQYEHSFHWSDGVQKKDKIFRAFSPGMECGYEIKAEESCLLQHETSEEMNHWLVRLTGGEPVNLAPGARHSFSYSIQTLTADYSTTSTAPSLKLKQLLDISFRRVQPTEYRKPPVDLAKRVSLADMIDVLDQPKLRGLTLRGPWSAMVADVERLKEWSGNFAITGLGPPEQVANVIERGHELGMEVFLAGRGSYREGSPDFEAYYALKPESGAMPDSHGQDEDHYYWASIQPCLDFEDLFGKPMANATQEERVEYWAKCFIQKWQDVRKSVEPQAPGRGIWFYAPFPGVAHVEPLDHYDLFLKHLSSLGCDLTVLPFYYGIEYTQAEYMVRRWKDAGAARVVFLPMRDFYTRPSHFFRVISAARRGGADGTCGFHFHVTASSPEDEWQWKSVMLAAQCNFPTPELPAFCLMEEPAKLLEALAEQATLPIEKTLLSVGQDPLIDKIIAKTQDDSKGFLRMSENSVQVIGTNEQGIEKAIFLLSRFQDMATSQSHPND